MTKRRLKVTFTSPARQIEEIMTPEQLRHLLTQQVADPNEVADALTFLEPETMGQGSFEGSNWSLTFTLQE